jgi:hypothetical protein
MPQSGDFRPFEFRLPLVVGDVALGLKARRLST